MFKAFVAVSTLGFCSMLFALGCGLFAASVNTLEADHFDVG